MFAWSRTHIPVLEVVGRTQLQRRRDVASDTSSRYWKSFWRAGIGVLQRVAVLVEHRKAASPLPGRRHNFAARTQIVRSRRRSDVVAEVRVAVLAGREAVLVIAAVAGLVDRVERVLGTGSGDLLQGPILVDAIQVPDQKRMLIIVVRRKRTSEHLVPGDGCCTGIDQTRIRCEYHAAIGARLRTRGITIAARAIRQTATHEMNRVRISGFGIRTLIGHAYVGHRAVVAGPRRGAHAGADVCDLIDGHRRKRVHAANGQAGKFGPFQHLGKMRPTDADSCNAWQTCGWRLQADSGRDRA